MKRKTQAISASLLALFAIGAFTPALAMAHGMMGGGNTLTPTELAARQTERFTTEAVLLGITVDEVKNYWAQGKGVREIATEKGISNETLQAKMTELKKTEAKARLATLVSQGVITQAQADARIASIEKMTASGKGKMGHGRKGMKGGMF
jgi:competence protein ComGC